MTKLSIKYLFLCLILLSTSGCFDTRYMAEKEYWFAEQNHKKIFATKQGNLDAADYESIVAGYRKVTETAPLELLSAKCQFIITQVYLQQKQYPSARQELKKIIQNFSSDQKIAPRAQFMIGKIYEAEGKFDLAVEEFEKVMDIYPMSQMGLQAPLYVARSQRARKDQENSNRSFKKAIRHYQKLVDEYSPETLTGARISRFLSDSMLEAEETEEALEAWDKILERNPSAPVAAQASFNKAKILATQKKDIPQAIQVFEEMLENNFEEGLDREFRYRLGYLYLENKQFDKALETFNQLIENNPEETRFLVLTHFAKANVYQRNQQLEKALEVYDQVEANFSDDPRSLNVPFLRFFCAKQGGDLDRSTTLLETAISNYASRFNSQKKDPINFTIGRLLFLCYAEQEDWPKALDQIVTLSELSPDDPRLLISEAQIYLKKLDDSSAAHQVFARMKEQFAGDDNLVQFAEKQMTLIQGDTIMPQETS